MRRSSFGQAATLSLAQTMSRQSAAASTPTIGIDDGIPNERDANPTSYDGDFFGVANALPTNANPDAYYWLDLSTTGLLGVATIRVACDGPSDLGDHLIIARTNDVCHIPLLAGRRIGSKKTHKKPFRDPQEICRFATMFPPWKTRRKEKGTWLQDAIQVR